MWLPVSLKSGQDLGKTRMRPWEHLEHVMVQTKLRQFIGRGRMVLDSAGLVPPLHLQRERVVRLMTLGENMAWDT